MRKKTKIICTIGPASESPAGLKKLVKGGANVFRLNFSHGDHAEHAKRIQDIRALREEMDCPIGIMLDTKGPEIRIKTFEKTPVELVEGNLFTLTTRDVVGTEEIVSITYDGLPADVAPGTVILIDDGLVAMEVVEIKDGTDIVCKVKNGGQLSNRKGVNVPGVDVKLPSVTEKDIDDILFGIEQGIDFIAASFIRKAQDVLEIRQLLQENGGDGIQIISKIECHQAIVNIEEIAKASDAVMVARGDLGVEVPLQQVPIFQKEIIQLCKSIGRPVITATQMLDSMIRNPRPTRAEVNDVASSVYDGCDAVMLSGETAAGKYPVEALTTMSSICQHVENHARILPSSTMEKSEYNITDAVSHACCECAKDVNAKAIVTSTSSGYTAKMIAKFRPECRIIATTPNKSVYHKLSLTWGVLPVLSKQSTSTDEMLVDAVNTAKQTGLVHDGDVVVISAGVPLGVSGTTNLLKVSMVGDVLVRGKGIGNGTVRGHVCVAKTLEDCKEMNSRSILIVKETDDRYLPYMKLARAIVCEDANISGHTAAFAVQQGKPAIIGAMGITELLKTDESVSLDINRGRVFKRS